MKVLLIVIYCILGQKIKVVKTFNLDSIIKYNLSCALYAMILYTSLFMAMAKEKSTDKYLWATEMWHRRIIECNVVDNNEPPTIGLIQRIFQRRKPRTTTAMELVKVH